MDLKQDLRCDTIDTREEYEMKVGKGMKAGHKGNGIGGSAGAGEDSQGELPRGLQIEQKEE